MGTGQRTSTDHVFEHKFVFSGCLALGTTFMGQATSPTTREHNKHRYWPKVASCSLQVRGSRLEVVFWSGISCRYPRSLNRRNPSTFHLGRPSTEGIVKRFPIIDHSPNPILTQYRPTRSSYRRLQNMIADHRSSGWAFAIHHSRLERHQERCETKTTTQFDF